MLKAAKDKSSVFLDQSALPEIYIRKKSMMNKGFNWR